LRLTHWYATGMLPVPPRTPHLTAPRISWRRSRARSCTPSDAHEGVDARAARDVAGDARPGASVLLVADGHGHHNAHAGRAARAACGPPARQVGPATLA